MSLKMRSQLFVAAVVTAAGAAAFSPPVAAQVIRIGFHAPLTGFAASDGKSALQRVLDCDTGLGVLRLADAGYERALAAKERHGLGIV